MESLLSVTRENSYNNSDKFKGIYVIGSGFHNNLPPFSPKVWQIDNNLNTDLMRRIVDYTGNKGLVIKNTLMLSSKNMTDEEDDDIINNDFGYFAQFTPGIFRGSSEVDVSISQTRTELENVGDDTLVTTCTFYKKELPLYQEMMNRCSTKVVQFDIFCKMTRNQNMKHIAAKGINSAYGRSKVIVLLGESNTNKRNNPRRRFAHEKTSKN